MFNGAELRIYLISLKCLGLICATHDAGNVNGSYVTKSDEMRGRMAFIIAQIGSWFAFIVMILVPKRFMIPVYTMVGNTYNIINYCFACLVISFIYLAFYLQRHRLLALLSLLLHYNRKDLQDRYAKKFLRQFCIYVSVSMLYVAIYGEAFTHKIPLLSRVLICAVFTYSYVLIGLIIVFYSCLTQVLAAFCTYTIVT